MADSRGSFGASPLAWISLALGASIQLSLEVITPPLLS
jgi:hypothetical protein